LLLPQWRTGSSCEKRRLLPVGSQIRSAESGSAGAQNSRPRSRTPALPPLTIFRRDIHCLARFQIQGRLEIAAGLVRFSQLQIVVAAIAIGGGQVLIKLDCFCEIGDRVLMVSLGAVDRAAVVVSLSVARRQADGFRQVAQGQVESGLPLLAVGQATIEVGQ